MKFRWSLYVKDLFTRNPNEDQTNQLKYGYENVTKDFKLFTED